MIRWEVRETTTALPDAKATHLDRHLADLEMAQRVLAGDPRALEEFVVRMRCVPRFLAGQNSRASSALDEHDLRDLVQDVLALVWRKLPTFQGHANLETWVYHFCAREFLSALRRKRQRAQLRPVPEDQSEPVDPVSSSNAPFLDADRVYASLETLSPEAVAVIRMKHFDGLTFEEIAQRLDISSNTAKTRYYRGLERLRDGLVELGGDAP